MNKPLFFLAGTLLAACASPAPEEPTKVGNGETAIVEASDTARNELGVVAWGVDATSPHMSSSAIHGYNEANERVVDIATEVTGTDDAHPQFAVKAAYDGEQAIMQVAAEETATSYVAHFVKNDLGGKPKVARAIEIASGDLEAGSAKLGGGAGMTTQGLHPTNIFGPVVCLVVGSKVAFVKSAGDYLGTTFRNKGCAAYNRDDCDPSFTAPSDPCQQVWPNADTYGKAYDCSQAYRDDWQNVKKNAEACVEGK